MALPTSEDAGAVDLKELVWVLYGPPGVGKSTLAAAMKWEGKKPLFLYTTPLKYIKAMKQAVPSWKVFCNAVKELETKRPTIYSVIVIDSVDVLYQHCRTDIMERRGLEHESDLDHGKGWDMVKKEFVSRVARLVTLGYGVVFVSHAFEKEIKTRMVQYTRMVPTLQGAAWQRIFPLADIVGYCGFSSTEDAAESLKTPRRVFFEPTEYVECKDWTGKMPKSQPMHKDADQTVRELLAALGGSRPKPGGPVAAKKTVSKTVKRS